MKTKIYLYFFMLMIVCISACKEEDRYATEGANTNPPGVPTDISWQPLYGGARFHYTIPKDENLLTVNAEYYNELGETVYFTSSFYKDSVDVYGFGAEKEYTVYLYGVNRAGKQSEKVPVKVFPLEPAISRVAHSIDLKAAFSSFFLDWENELKQLINIYVSYKYIEKGAPRDMVSVFSSNKPAERRFIRNVYPEPTDPVRISVWVEDQYGNSSEQIDFGNVYLLEDYKLDKSIMNFPEANDSTVILRDGTRFNTGVPAMFGQNLEGRMWKLIDDVIDEGDLLNFFHTGSLGRTGMTKDNNVPWNIILDLGDYYQLSRINTVQRHTGCLNCGQDNFVQRDMYYRYENCGHFALYYFDDDERFTPFPNAFDTDINEVSYGWVLCSEQKTPIPLGISELQYVLLGKAGDEALMFPDNPQYTKPTRWLRFECLHCFDDNYTSTGANCMSELTVYGKRAN